VEHVGWPGILHGGVTFTLMDESLGWALYFQGKRGVTAKAQTSFKLPIRTGTPLIIRGWTTGRRRQLVTARAEVRTAGPESELMAEMDATMFLVAEDAPQQESKALSTGKVHMQWKP
jgi:acyl-coenzyme A thioesterase PaaI-like protein